MTPFSFVMPLGVGQFKLSDMLLVAGIALVTTSLLIMYRKRRSRGIASRLTPHEQIERLQQQRGMRGDLEDLMVEIEQLAKRLGSQLDAKTIQLEQVLREADRRIDQLESLGHHGPNADRWSTDVQASGVGQLGDSPPSEPLAQAVYTLADQGLSPIEIAKRLDELVGKIELILALRKA